MVETPAPFEARLDAALAMNGLGNAEFAAAFGPAGQQLVHGWRKRGRIGTPSVAKARAILPKTNMDWLQDGVGDPERLTSSKNFSPPLHAELSRVARLDLAILAKAVKVISIDESVRGKLSPMQFASRLMDLYDRLANGAAQADLIAQLFDDEGHQGDAHDQQSSTGEE